ncbi:hypothetical protein SPLC1_S100370 [Arthrospira platensis C1]|nr:hypothetical protein SPLC1_S100370 [Arthrospira platensis C1]
MGLDGLQTRGYIYDYPSPNFTDLGSRQKAGSYYSPVDYLLAGR